MAAGLGFKTFTTGEVLTAADTNGYLMQGVLVFASSAARASAITSPQEGQYSYLKDTNSTEYYDGAAWIAAPIGDITGVTAGTGISGGGTSGTVTITNSMATEITAKGDLIVGTGNATFDNLPVGSNTQILVADSSTATGLKWATASSGITNAQSYVSTAQSTTSITYAALGTAQAVTLTTGTKVLVLLSMSATSDNTNTNPRSFMSVAVSGSTTIAASDANSVMSRCLQANSLNGRVGVALFLTCTAGSNTFTAQFRQPDYTGTFSDRQMIVIDLGS